MSPRCVVQRTSPTATSDEGYVKEAFPSSIRVLSYTAPDSATNTTKSRRSTRSPTGRFGAADWFPALTIADGPYRIPMPVMKPLAVLCKLAPRQSRNAAAESGERGDGGTHRKNSSCETPSGACSVSMRRGPTVKVRQFETVANTRK